MERKTKIAPVAEYRGRALVEVAGKHRAVWRGTEYATDGKTYLVSEESEGSMLFHPFDTELAAKEFLDQVANGEVATRVGPLTLDTFLTCRRVCGILRITYCSETVARHWDENQGVFI